MGVASVAKCVIRNMSKELILKKLYSIFSRYSVAKSSTLECICLPFWDYCTRLYSLWIAKDIYMTHDVLHLKNRKCKLWRQYKSSNTIYITIKAGISCVYVCSLTRSLRNSHEENLTVMVIPNNSTNIIRNFLLY